MWRARGRDDATHVRCGAMRACIGVRWSAGERVVELLGVQWPTWWRVRGGGRTLRGVMRCGRALVCGVVQWSASWRAVAWRGDSSPCAGSPCAMRCDAGVHWCAVACSGVRGVAWRPLTLRRVPMCDAVQCGRALVCGGVQWRAWCGGRSLCAGSPCAMRCDEGVHWCAVACSGVRSVAASHSARGPHTRRGRRRRPRSRARCCRTRRAPCGAPSGCAAACASRRAPAPAWSKVCGAHVNSGRPLSERPRPLGGIQVRSEGSCGTATAGGSDHADAPSASAATARAPRRRGAAAGGLGRRSRAWRRPTATAAAARGGWSTQGRGACMHAWEGCKHLPRRQQREADGGGDAVRVGEQRKVDDVHLRHTRRRGIRTKRDVGGQAPRASLAGMGRCAPRPRATRRGPSAAPT